MSVSLGESDRPHTHTHGESSGGASPSSDRPTKRLASSRAFQNETDEPTVEQLQRVALDLQEHNNELAKDRDLADREVRRLRRIADNLQRELDEVREADPRAKEIRAVCDYWMAALGKTKRTKCPVNGARWNKVRARMNDGYTVDQLKQAIDGCAARPFVGPHGRQATDEHGAKRHDDLELICRDETTVERFVGYTEPEDREPESVGRQFVRHVYGEDCKLQYRPASKEPRPHALSAEPPIDKVLGALHATGCQIVSYQAHADQWSAQCPAHEDRSPSLSIHRKPDGKILLKCWASCTTEEVVHALGLEWRDLWEDSDQDLGRLNGPASRTVPAHLRQAMQRLLATDERQAA